jgi:hypothetical protein
MQNRKTPFLQAKEDARHLMFRYGKSVKQISAYLRAKQFSSEEINEIVQTIAQQYKLSVNEQVSKGARFANWCIDGFAIILISSFLDIIFPSNPLFIYLFGFIYYIGSDIGENFRQIYYQERCC